MASPSNNSRAAERRKQKAESRKQWRATMVLKSHKTINTSAGRLLPVATGSDFPRPKVLLSTPAPRNTEGFPSGLLQATGQTGVNRTKPSGTIYLTKVQG